MKLAIMQPYLFPYLGYYQLINAVDKFVIYDDVSFIKQGWINRNNILVNNKKHTFLVPLIGASSFKLILNTQIDNKHDWAKKILKTIEQNYKKAPYFNNVFPLIREIFQTKNDKISELALESLLKISNYLEIKTIFEVSSIVYENSFLKGKERVIDICKRENASIYINAIGGEDLYQKNYFQNANLELQFIKANTITYTQFTDNFVNNLSIIDVLMFNSKKQTQQFLEEYKLL